MIAKLLIATTTATVLFAGQAEARRLHFWWQQDQQYEDPYLDPNADQPSADGQDLYVQEQFNQDQYDQYMREMGHAKRGAYQQSYYEPEVAAPVRKLKTATKPAKKQSVVVISKPAIKSSVWSAPPKSTLQTASIASRFGKKSTAKSVDCGKGAAIVSGFGFTGVSSKSCSGTTLVYNAIRSGKNFEINVNAATGELTNVKRL